MATTLTDKDIERYDKTVLTDADIEKLDSAKVLTDEDIERMDNFDVLKNIVDHPFQAIFNPAAKTLTGKSLQERAVEATPIQESPVKVNNTATVVAPTQADFIIPFLKQAGAGMAGSVADIATTPASYIPLPLGKLLGKIPFRGTTLGEVATKVPVGQMLNKDVKEIIRYQDALKSLPEQTAASQAPLQVAPQIDPVTKVMTALNEAEVVRGEQELLYTAERAKRAEQLQKIGTTESGEKAYIKQLSSLKGEMEKIDFQGIRDRVSQTDVDSLFNMVEKNTVLSQFEKVAAKNGLSRLLGQEGGLVPRQSEIDLLREVFPKEFIETVLTKRSTIDKYKEGFAEVINLPRALMSSFDMSAPLRQGIFLIGRPKQFLPAFGNMFKYFADEKAYDGMIAQIKSRPTYELMRAGKLPLSDMHGQLTAREEAFMSNLAEKIPLMGNVVKASNRAYSGFLNKLRADVFDDLVNKAQLQGIAVDGKVLKNISQFIGNATGRGHLPEALERSAIALNAVLFSPRLVASRLNLLNPKYYVGLDPFTRQEALKSLFTFTGTATTVMSLAALGGAKIGTDPRSSDFGKIRIGDTRYDVMGGFQQYIKLATQLITGEHISSTTGVKTTMGEGYKPLTRMDILGRFVQTKEAPVASFITNIMKGESFEGDKIDIPKEIATRFVPMVIQDMYDMQQSKGFESIGMSIPAIFGVGVQTYAPTPSEIVHSYRSVLTNAKKIRNYGQLKEAEDLIQNNKEILEMGAKLEPYQKILSDLERTKFKLQKNVVINEADKKSKIFEIDNKIKETEDRMEKLAEQLRAMPK